MDILRIEWTSGIVQELTNVPVKQYLTIVEPNRLAMDQAGELQLQCWTGMTYSIESSCNLSDWTPLTVVTNLTGCLQWNDPAPTDGSKRFYRSKAMRIESRRAD